MKTAINYQKDIYIPEWLERELDGNQLLARILLQRGINTQEKVKRFLDPEHYQATVPAEFPGMEEAVDRILTAVKAKKKICIYGDYDVDGVTSTVILLDLLNKIKGQAVYHLPDRFKEGYGMNKAVLRRLAGEVDLIITCDCGISNQEEIALAKELGLEVIVTDHHQLPDKLPLADLILSAKLLAEDHQAFNIPGAGMAYFLAVAILNKLGIAEESKDFLDLLSMAIVADVVPLLEENRYLLQLGLPELVNTKRPGLIELFKVAGIADPQNMTEEDIAFRIAPRLNSAGRILKADLAVELLLADEEFLARKKAIELEAVNQRRKKLQDKVIEEALEMLGENRDRKSIVLYRPHWKQGVIGIAAGRLCEDYQVPVLLMCQKDDGQTVTGSARSIPSINIIQQLKECKRYLTKYGGHAGAAGFSLQRDNLTGFSKNISSLLAKELAEKETDRVIDIDGELSLDKVGKKDYYALRRLAPFGEQNPKPKFIAYDTELIHSRTTSGDRHLRLILAQNGVQHSAIWWWAGKKKLAKKVDLIYSLDINDFQGERILQLLVDDILTENRQVEKVVEKSNGLEFELLDYRNWQGKKLELPVFADAAYYYEGINKIKDKEIINRYQLTDKKSLVLLSCPPSLEIFRELIYANRPAKLVLAFSKADITGSTFLQQLTGLIKYIINKKGGQLDVYQIAVLTGQLESTIVAGLQYLEAKGYISLNSFNPRYYIVRNGEGKVKHENKMYLKNIKDLISETRSFIKYILSMDLSIIKNLIG
ncbi:single-stranded-DNA-specific exonuclease RecJ [Iocasia frigidifontis]|uniref:Single-stranded-DNA-specific exonuclease RecJ n=1 Tax=Iocasia fonsfrigidae TaxID=2682810 RepID=A0A8A7KI50_9FIRM|nr:single-stranded-DNA-specific exonuclease RecJ [Iocasia fonsfrigidae]QTL97552.1 single-stranded-DNA-specific exonuclease RecJ [Iocasia fonsfrigidae]